MLKIQNIIIAGLALLLSGCSGCTNIPEPKFLTDEPMHISESDRMRYKGISRECEQMGWGEVRCYFKKDSWVPESLFPTVNRSYVEGAMQSFNFCWDFDPDNYNAYWGAGVVRGIQATFTDDELLTEKYLKQSVEFINMALKHEVPSQQKNFVLLDLANAYNGLGAFYLKAGKQEQSAKNLNLAQKILQDVIKEEPENGRAYFLLAATSFYQGKYVEAKQLAAQADTKHFKVPDDFLKEISSKIVVSPVLSQK
jgi:tetratricopeptide (TPR) repeat protein